MRGPKHLWSGDWQQESAQASSRLGDRATKPRDDQTPKATAEAPTPRRPRVTPALLVALVALVMIAAGALAVTTLDGSTGRTASTAADPTIPSARSPAPTSPGTPTAPSVPTPTAPSVASAPRNYARAVTWLGMEIESVQPGAAVIVTLPVGSLGERAGLEPGDVILDLNHHAIHGAGDIARAIRGLQPGDQVPMQIGYGSSLAWTQITLAAPPSAHP
jgi:S1-C subfamily serine protease